MDHVSEILRDIHSLQDLNSSRLEELRATGVGRLPITKFKVSPSEFADWDKVNDIQNGGYEYDAQSERLVIKANYGILHDCLIRAFIEWFRSTFDDLRMLIGSTYPFGCIIGQSVTLHGPFSHSTKEPDIGFRVGSSVMPTVAVEISSGEGRKKLFEDAIRWIEGSQGQTRVVILVDIEESIPAWQSECRGDERDHLYGLDVDRLQLFNEYTLAVHIIRWHQKHDKPLAGDCTAHVYIYRRDRRPRKVLRHSFSLYRPGKTFYVSDQAFILTSELAGGDLPTPRQPGEEPGNCDVPSDSEDEESYASQKFDEYTGERIVLPLDDLKKRMVERFCFQQEERVEQRVKYLGRKYGCFNVAQEE